MHENWQSIQFQKLFRGSTIDASSFAASDYERIFFRIHRFTKIVKTMVVLRFLLIVFNVAVVTFLIYRMLKVFLQPLEKSKKMLIMIGGILLVLATVVIFILIFAVTFQYFLIYSVAISLFLYLTKQL